MMNELLLVVSVLGSHVSEEDKEGRISERFVPVADCLNWLQDLQRALRSDKDDLRPIANQLGTWKVVEEKLIPIALVKRDDPDTILTLAKLFVILTKPMTKAAKQAALINIDVKSKKFSEETIQDQVSLKENALLQSKYLMEYKRLFLKEGLLEVFVDLMQVPLSKTEQKRDDKDNSTIELVLHLIRNLLCAEPVVKNSTSLVNEDIRIHHQLIAVFQKELVFDIMVFLGEGISHKKNERWNLLIMEILHFLVRNQDPSMTAKSDDMVIGSSSNMGNDENKRGGGLSAARKREKAKLSSVTNKGARHSRFGGTLKLKDTSKVLKASSTSNSACAARRKNKQTAAFTADARGYESSYLGTFLTKIAMESFKALNSFSRSFVEKCYGPVMKSLKDEFRRDSNRLEANDKVVFFKVVWFFSVWQRTHLELGGGSSSSSARVSGTAGVGQLLFTLDLFSFNLVTSACETFIAEKKPTALTQAVALYKEMVKLLSIMNSSPDESQSIMSLGLQNQLYFASEPKDKVFKLLSAWKSGTQSKQYLCDLVELVHETIKLQDLSRRKWKKEVEDISSKGRKEKSVTDEYKENCVSFELDKYVGRAVSSGAIKVYTHLLREYSTNGIETNHHIVSFFTRLCKHKMEVVKTVFDEGDGKAALAVVKEEAVTLEPLLFNMELMIIYDRILHDKACAVGSEFGELIKFVTTIVRHFATAAQRNPLLCVEGLFHVGVRYRRHCEMVTNSYLDEKTLSGGREEYTVGSDKDEEENEKQGESNWIVGKKDEGESEAEWSEAEDGVAVESNGAGGGEESEDGLGMVGSDSSDDEGERDQKAENRRAKKEAKKLAKEERRRKKKFSNEEDAIIKSAFFVHPTEDTAIEAIIQEETMKQGAKDAKKVRRRARVLGLLGEKEQEQKQEQEKEQESAGASATNQDNEDRWNDNRKFVPKSKSKRKSYGQEEMGEEGAGKKRLKKLGGQGGAAEDDDETILAGAAGGSGYGGGARLFYSDDDSE
ncbi:hypothetical protein TrCOL_g1634 [Triparma columacea]|nr:hypothetical protein TrCOL_g1634 [Triparma columacea]